MTTALQDKFRVTRNELDAALIERGDEIDLAMTALLTNEHCLFVGPPGTAKSLLARVFSSWIDSSYFEWLLNKTTDPSEILGAIDIIGLKAGDHRRITKNKLPEASIAFLDEIFKCSSPTLNTVLKILNEREFDNGLTKMACPLRLCIAASNEWPTEAKELGALFDRFMFRKLVEPVAAESSVDRLMFASDLNPVLSTTLTATELQDAQDEAFAMAWSDEAKDMAHTIRRRITAEGIVIGDRRLRKSVAAVQSFAYINGQTRVEKDDLEVLSHVWWVDPAEQPKLVADVITEVARPTRMMVAQLLADANQVRSECDASDLEKAADACGKLKQIHDKLLSQGTEKSIEAAKRIDQMSKDIREKSLQAFV